MIREKINRKSASAHRFFLQNQLKYLVNAADYAANTKKGVEKRQWII